MSGQAKGLQFARSAVRDRVPTHEDVTVATVLRSGGRYDPRWVVRLQRAVERHLPHARFLCLSDCHIPGVGTVPLEHDWPGWWAKIELFRPGLFDTPRVLYLDLDTEVLGSLEDLGRFRGAFAMLRDFYQPTRCGSGVMAWDTGLEELTEIHQRFRYAPQAAMKTPGGDQRFIEEVVGLSHIQCLQDAVPGQIVSYKVHCKDGVPEDARLLCFHGQPKQDTLGWL